MLRKKITKSKGKVRNATPTEVDGIKFRSKLEAFTYEELKKAKIKAEYEPTHFTLVPKFTYNDENVRAMTYLPDFVGNNFIIECKGLITDSFPLRWKIFKHTLYLLGKTYKLYLVRNQEQVSELVKKLKEDEQQKHIHNK